MGVIGAIVIAWMLISLFLVLGDTSSATMSLVLAIAATVIWLTGAGYCWVKPCFEARVTAGSV